jgi:outer membrane usher protein FimD/PapC
VGNLRADLLHQFGDAASTQYAATIEGGIVAGKGKFSFGGRELSSTATVVRLKGGDKSQRFEVLVDESPRGTVKPGDNLVLFLNPYDTYSVRLRSSGSGMSNFDTAARKVTLYPGNVATLDWDVAPVVIVFGRAIDLRGQPIANADITTSRGNSQTNEDGYFQVETAQNEQITVRDRLGKMCSIPPSKARPIDGYLARGEAECR